MKDDKAISSILKAFVIFLFTAAVFFIPPVTSHAGEVPEEYILETVGKAVFEVVVAKPVNDSLSYEKPLPLDLLPYAMRNDKYHSIGTAFAMGPGRFISAAHVMKLDYNKTQYGEVKLRDREGKVYGIDRILKYSIHRDFVIFTLKDKEAERFFEVNKSPKVNKKVYAVGNALGEGVIMRDGLYASDTPEEVNGEWNWIRFSAATSPGNSGGPLLDMDGKVIGIVIGKSENENLNYALPISEALNAADNKGVAFTKVKYSIENMDMTKYATFEREFKLPKSYGALKAELVKSFKGFSDTLLKNFLKENGDGIFPNGKGSKILLHNAYMAVFPNLIKKDKDGIWVVFVPSEKSTSVLDNNGFIQYGFIADTFFMNIRKPDDIPLKKFYSDSKLFMDLVLQGIPINREVASEKVKITSMGKASDDYQFKDSYGRVWIVRAWDMEYSDDKLLAFILPVPGGCIAMLKSGQTGQIDDYNLPDMKVLADFVYVSYYGTFKQWREFLNFRKLLPDIFSTIDIRYDRKNKTLNYKSKRLSFSHTSATMEVTGDSDLNLLFDYFLDNGAVVWDVGSIVLGEDKNNQTYFGVYRQSSPAKGLNDSYRSKWENIAERKFPYNSSSYYSDGKTVIKTTYGSLGETAKDLDKPLLYSVTYQVEGAFEQDEMTDRLQKILSSINILEGG